MIYLIALAVATNGLILLGGALNYIRATRREKRERLRIAHLDLTPPEKRVFSQLRSLRHDSIWGIAISNVCETPDAGRFRELIQSLKSQAADDEGTMRAILGENIDLVKAL